jgi:hypothetical protein
MKRDQPTPLLGRASRVAPMFENPTPNDGDKPKYSCPFPTRQQSFIARAWKAANDKARELGWIV